jgi:iron complex outermembrane receptor protein
MHHCKKRITAKRRNSFRVLALAVAIGACLPAYATAEEPRTTREAVVNFDIPAGDLSVALERFSTQSAIQVMYRQDLVAGKRAPIVKGAYSPSLALSRLLAGTGLSAEPVNDKTYVLKTLPVQAKVPQKSATNSNSAADAAVVEEEAQELETMVVVGSRLMSSPVETAMPIKIITREQIDRSGAGGIAQMLSYLSEVSVSNSGDRDIGGTAPLQDGASINSSTVQMRGLPRGTTLVLINGRRAGQSSSFTSSGQFDLSTIPLALVDRIEVLPAGSSAVYGGDGLAGVINIVLRKEADALELRLRTSQSDGFNANQVGLLWGKTWEGGDLTLTANWREQSALHGSERQITSDYDFRRYGGYDRRIPFGNPGTVYSLAGCPQTANGYCYLPLTQRGNLPGLNSQYAAIPSGQNGQQLTISDFSDNEGVVNSSTPLQHILSAEKNISLAASGRLEVAETTELFAELTYSKRKIPAYEMPFGLTAGEYGAPSARVSASHPNNPFGVDVGVNFFFRESGAFASYSQTFVRGLFGLRQKFDHFDWEVSLWQTRDKSVSGGGFGFNDAAIASALAANQINPFVGDGSAPASFDVLESALRPINHRSGSVGTGLTSFVRGDVFRLPAGSVETIAGFEYQRSDISLHTDSPTLLVTDIDGSSASRALFAEMRLPIWRGRGKASDEALAATAALRSEWSDRFSGSAVTKTLGLEYRPLSQLMLRGTYSTAFRPILAYSSAQRPLITLSYVQDPKFNNEWFDVKSVSDGGVPLGLKPETSTTTTLGAVLSLNSGWRFAATHWDIEFRDRISYVSGQEIVDNEEFYSARVVRNPTTDRLEMLDVRQVNINLSNSRGVDIEAEGQIATKIGTFYPSLSATYTYEYDEQLVQGAPLSNKVARLGYGGWSPRWKIVPRLIWEGRSNISGMVAGRYVSRYTEVEPLVTGPNAGQYQSLGDFWMVDFNFELDLRKFITGTKLLSGARLNFGMTNALDKLPVFCMICGSGYDGSQYDIVGRTIYGELRLEF